MTANQQPLFYVGKVSKLFPGTHSPYIGIIIELNGFATYDELVIRNESGEITVAVSSIEIDRRRVNVAQPGDDCAIKPAHPLPKDFEVKENSGVFVNEASAKKAASLAQTFSNRPSLQEDIDREREHFPVA